MELIWASEEFLISGRPYPDFPIIVYDDMKSCIEANEFMRHYLLRGSIGSKRSWPSVGRALYDFLSFLQAHELNWRDVERGDTIAIVAAYRDYSLNECKLAVSTTRQRLHYVCQFYLYAHSRKWIENLPFHLEDRRVNKKQKFLAHIDSTGGFTSRNDIMPSQHQKLPKYLKSDQAKNLILTTRNPHHRALIEFALHTGLRREELATFPLAYVEKYMYSEEIDKNIKIILNPQDGHGIRTKGSKEREIFISIAGMSAIVRYLKFHRNERVLDRTSQSKTLFVNKNGYPYSGDGKGIEKIVRNCAQKAGIKAYPHMLRHTYATQTLLALKAHSPSIDPLIFLQRQLGHASIQTTAIYLHLIDEMAETAILSYDEELRDGV